ncbi:MAG TPA: cation:proton antiporter [Polyangiaceae bacterium]|nr:cation:proton antiporter [Polyangiaceae bacterium]
MRSRLTTLAAYVGMLAAAVALFFLVRAHGETLVAPVLKEVPTVPSPRAPVDALKHVLLAIAVVVAASRALGALFRFLRQPAVIGEVVAGILLGPSLLGRVAPNLQAFLLPREVAPYLGVIAQVGVILFMFLIGLELDTRLLRKRSDAMVAISHASIVVPFVLGSTLALWLYPKLSSRDVSFTGFALFMGVSLSVTAFPVLARILTDRGLSRTRLGTVALACAAVDDATAWCLLAFVVGIVRAEATSSFVTLGLTVLYIASMLGLVRPLVGRFVRRQELVGSLDRSAITAAFVALLASALLTEAIGIHALFGAFLLGAIVPHESLLARELTRRIEDIVVVLLLPIFFAFTGMRTEIGLLGSVTDWILCVAIIVVACAGKFGGSAVAARLSGLGWREACSLGVLLNTRGLMELIVLNVGLDLGVISPRLFAMLVVMAIVTTLLTSPLLHVLERRAGSHALGALGQE